MHLRAVADPLFKGRAMPLCLTGACLLIGLALAAYLLLSQRNAGRGPGLALDRPPLVGDGEASLAGLDLAQQTAQMPGLAYDGSDSRLRDLRYSLHGVDLAIDRVRIAALDPEHWPPHYADLRLQGLKAEISRPGWPGFLRRVGGDGILAYELHPERGTLSVKLAGLDAPGLGRLTMTFTLDRVDPQAPFENLAAGKLSTLSIDFLDAGLFAEAIGELAQHEGLNEADTRSQLAEMARAFAAQANYPFLRELLVALERVAERRDPGLRLLVSATPAEPYPLTRLGALRLSPLPDLMPLQGLNLRIDTE